MSSGRRAALFASNSKFPKDDSERSAREALHMEVSARFQ